MKSYIILVFIILLSCSKNDSVSQLNKRIKIVNNDKTILVYNNYTYKLKCVRQNNFTKFILNIGIGNEINFFIDDSLDIYFPDLRPEYMFDKNRLIKTDSTYVNIQGKQNVLLTLPSHYKAKISKTNFFFPYSRKLIDNQFSVCFRSDLTNYKYLILVFEKIRNEVNYLYSFELKEIGNVPNNHFLNNEFCK